MQKTIAQPAGRLLMACLCLAVRAAAEQTDAPEVWVPLTSFDPAPPVVRVQPESAWTDTTLEISIPGFFRQEVTIAGTNFVRLRLPDSPVTREAGCPEVPFLACKLAVPDQGAPEWRILRQETAACRLAPCAPSKGPLRRSTDGAAVPCTFGPPYSVDAPYPAGPAGVSRPFRVRSLRGVVLSVFPLRVNPVSGEVTVSKTLVVRVTLRAPAREPWADVAARALHDVREFRSVYADQFLNLPALVRREFLEPGEVGNMLVICHDEFYEAMLPFVRWKRQKGIPTDIVRQSEAGSTASNLQRFIQGFYDTNGLTFLHLVGDAELLPAPPGEKGWMVGDPCDLRYVLLDGDDMYPDAAVSRFPAQDLSKVSNMVQRAVTYEQAPTPGADWYHMALGAASSSTAGGYYDYERTAMIRSNLLAFTYTHVDHFYETNISVSLISAAFNEGRSLANFIGHGDPQSWSWYNRLGSPRFGVGHVWTLTNTNRLPFVIIAGCDAGRYTLTNECLAESFLKVGTPEAPCGGIAVQAAFDAELAEPPCTGQAEMMDRLVDGTYQQVGLLCLSGIIKALDVHTEPSPPGTAGEENAEQRHLFGDGSLTLFTDSPAVMTVSHAGSLEFGATRCTVEVPGLPGALCALYDPAAAQLCGSAYTDTNGLAVIRIAPPAASPLTLTVTAFNRLPYIAALGLLPDASSSGWLLQVR